MARIACFRRVMPLAALAAVATLAALVPAVPALAQAADQTAQESAAVAAVERPARGMTKSQVEAKYGAPSSRQDAVGQPPISRWDYPGMIVYFEHDHVVHAVLTSAN